MIVPSGTRLVAGEIEKAGARDHAVVLDGPLMGGGPDGSAMRRHIARGLPFYATPAAARTFNDDLDAVSAMGVRLVQGDEVKALLEAGAVLVRSGDLRFAELMEAMRLVGESEPLDGIALAVQDHGQSPPGISDRTFRFEKMAESLARSRHLSGFFHYTEELPSHFTRMKAAADLVGSELPLVVGDTGPAALWGASLAAEKTPCLAVNFGNNHTLMGFVHEGEIDGLFEHHTSMLDPAKMEDYIRRFAAGRLPMAEVFSDGGHGTLTPSVTHDLSTLEIIVTGPRRRRFGCMNLPMSEAALHGDMMLTGCYGLLQGYLAKRVPA
jgi:uncharacterized protein (DUF1786 family)